MATLNPSSMNASSQLRSNLVSLSSQKGRKITFLPSEIWRLIFSYFLDSPQTIKNLNLSCWQFRHILMDHPFIILADAIYRLSQAKEEEIPQIVSTVRQPAEWIWTKLTAEQARILQDLNSQGTGLGRCLEHLPFLASFDTNVLTSLLEHVVWIFPQKKKDTSAQVETILSNAKVISDFFKQDARHVIDWEVAGKIFLEKGLYQYRVKAPRPNGSSKSLTFHEFLAGWMRVKHQAGQKPFVHLPFAARWIQEFDGLSLQYAPDDLRKQKEFVLKAVEQNGLALQWTSVKLKDDEEVVLQAVQENIQSIQFASDRLQKHPGFSSVNLLTQLKHNTHRDAILAVIKANASALKHVAHSLKKGKRFLEQAIMQNPQALAFVSKELKKDRNFLLKIVKEKPEAISCIPDEWKGNRSFFLQALQSNPKIYPLIPLEFTNDINFAFEACKSNVEVFDAFPCDFIEAQDFFIRILKDLKNQHPENESFKESQKLKELIKIFSSNFLFKKSKNLILEAVKIYPGFFTHIDALLCKDRKMILAVVQQEGELLQEASPELQKDPAIVLAAVKQNGMALQYADSELKKDRNIVLTAVKQCGMALYYAAPELQKDREIVLAAVQQNREALQYADPALQEDPTIALAVSSKSDW